MFSFIKRFFSSEPQPAIRLADRQWIEHSMWRLIELFGSERLLHKPFVLPELEDLPFDDYKDGAQQQAFFEYLCAYLGLPKEEFPEFEVVGDFDMALRYGAYGGAGIVMGLYEWLFAYRVSILRSASEMPSVFVAVTAHELMHVKLIDYPNLDMKEALSEPLTDLASIYWGFGIFAANARIFNLFNTRFASGYLLLRQIAYANALLCFISGFSPDVVASYLNPNTLDLFWQNYNYLKHPAATLTNKFLADFVAQHHGIQRVVETTRMMPNLNLKDAVSPLMQQHYDLILLLKKAHRNLIYRKFQDALDCFQEAERKLKYNKNFPENILLNNIGYTLSMLERYEEAIQAFDKTIKTYPDQDTAYTNRGFAYLKLGKLDEAWADISKGYQMNSRNAWAHRNMGAYYLAKNQAAEALPHLKKALTFKELPDYIYYYMYEVYTKLGKPEKAQEYFQLMNQQ